MTLLLLDPKVETDTVDIELMLENGIVLDPIVSGRIASVAGEGNGFCIVGDVEESFVSSCSASTDAPLLGTVEMLVVPKACLLVLAIAVVLSEAR